MIDPRVQAAGDIAVLTFNFESDPPDSAGTEEVDLSRWHATEVFRRYEDDWKLMSTHWSLTQSNLLELAEAGQLSFETPEFPSVEQEPPSGEIPGLVVTMERAALDRWGAGDPGGFLDIIAEEYTYFDPSLDERIDDLQAITDYLEPLRGRVRSSRYEMLDPYVQTDGTTAVLTFNLKSYGAGDDGTETLGAHWHSTEIYRRIAGEWKLISTHWSYTASWLEVLAGRL
jgi:ketosteroid isomerase-like protein